MKPQAVTPALSRGPCVVYGTESLCRSLCRMDPGSRVPFACTKGPLPRDDDQETKYLVP